MRFLLTREQADFARSLDAMLTAADTPAVVRAWENGDHGPGLTVWRRVAEAGVFALAVPETYDGMGLLPVELVLAFRELGRHGVPGPYVETAAAAVLLAGSPDLAKEWLPRIAAGEAVVTLAEEGGYALDADAAEGVFVLGDRVTGASAGSAGELRVSADTARRLYAAERAGDALPVSPESLTAARELAMLLTAAQALGVGDTLLAQTVAYVKQRTQFGTPIGAFQAVKHRLADTLVGLEFARPLLYGAALSMSGPDIAAAKVTAGEASYAAARTALQLHGAIGYTQELDLSLWLRKARPLRDAWGTPGVCRARVLEG
ncbi:putative acyl-CoA dehydrogenase FadE [Streptomyces spiroverticillatus]|uniref:Acyl-CoA dehydrogenase FadE n=1 Tax=Streptomyces finlayi TaxID=67296 RepID=A0A918WXE3_9ACTN|nr:acyl-CoA dehydrogenase family protein [Streptomyces finlayi]GGZ92624.1 putative acyl-CoA dehydrogenase FadE [Streptomyces spiroverticillatus]GHC92926.1 putative acyl-CoA dehydrogenase FadE [Streptomyces finlayi]